MQKTAEAVSLGHPDKISDYISSYILDRMIEQDSSVKYAVEVMVKDNTVVLGGEIKGNCLLNDVNQYVIDALAEIGYTKEYSKIWGDCAINPEKIKVINLVGQQSSEINQGVEQDGWGDQGVFVGYACQGEANINKEIDLTLDLIRHETKNRINVIKNYGDIPPIKCYPNMLNLVFMIYIRLSCTF